MKENISNFGGDTNNVSIFGESAGGTSVYLLTVTPLSKGLFHRAILQSPWLHLPIFRGLKEENENGPPAEYEGIKRVRRVLGEEPKAVLDSLRAMPAEEVRENFPQRWPVVTDGWKASR